MDEYDNYKNDFSLVCSDFDYESIKNERKIDFNIRQEEIEVLDDLANFEQYVRNLQMSADGDDIFASLLTIFNILHEGHLKEKIDFLNDICFTSIIFPILCDESMNDDIITTILDIFNIIIANSLESQMRIMISDEFLDFLLNSLNDERFIMTHYYFFKTIGYLLVYNKSMQDYLLATGWVNDFQNILLASISFVINEKKIFFSLGDNQIDLTKIIDNSDLNLLFKDYDLTSNSDFYHQLYALNLKGELSLMKIIIQANQTLLNEEMISMFSKVAIFSFSLPYILSTKKNSLEILIEMTKINSVIVMGVAHCCQYFFHSLYDIKDQSDQQLIGLSLELVYLFTSCDINYIDAKYIIPFLHKVIDSFMWADLTIPIRFSLLIASKLSYINEIQSDLLYDEFLNQIDLYIVDSTFSLKEALIEMLCNFIINSNHEFKGVILARTNIVLSICSATDNFSDNDDQTSLIIFALADMINYYTCSSWSLIDFNLFCDNINKEFIETQTLMDKEIGEAAQFILSILNQQ